MKKYRLIAKKGEGTFSEVIKAQNIEDGKYHAIKCMKSHFSSISQVNNLREIQALRKLSPHPNIVDLNEILFDQPTGRLAIVFDLLDANLYELIRGRQDYLSGKVVKSYMHQLFSSLDHMHRKGIFHRDIKPENILVDKNGKNLKLADFGSCRGIYNKQPYTEYISTRWYRAPECLLTDGYYGPEMDIWGAGCVLFEIISLYPLFPGSDEVDQINRIHKILGSPSADLLRKLKLKKSKNSGVGFPQQRGIGISHLIPHANEDCVDLLTKSLKYDMSKRITSSEAMRHPYFSEFATSHKMTSSDDIASGAPRCHRTSAKQAKSLSKQDGLSKMNRDLPSIAGAQQASGQDSKSEDSPHSSCADSFMAPKSSLSEKKAVPSRIYEQEKPVPKKSRHHGNNKTVLPPISQARDGIDTRVQSVDRRLARYNTLPSMPSNLKRQQPEPQKKKRRRQNKKYAHVTSSGYGTGGYNPTGMKAGQQKATEKLRKKKAYGSMRTLPSIGRRMQ
eukprot:CAMPEP_0113552014 /NCGR_PEP_ID=MMETSP0015_2-20120614/14836_1 /TAXON_ID=2838 /ORGANISM="Odontella" /LENGTH=503 /DNA_ID=CAMNT_0000452953 /DNA_START=604 /DNA_END=2115 /DNA_ORIENTATION=+ /assembly_acc=CAM_ASM_000160